MYSPPLCTSFTAAHHIVKLPWRNSNSNSWLRKINVAWKQFLYSSMRTHTDYRDLYLPAFIIAGCFAFIAVVLSILLTFQHLRSKNGLLQFISWFLYMLVNQFYLLWNPRLSLACDILRNCYEAFALYSFGRYLIACLDGYCSRYSCFRFSAKPYQFLPASEYGKVTTQTTKEKLTLEEGDKERSAVLERTETEIEAPGTVVKENIQDIVVGGQHVVKDIVLQATFHHISVASDDDKENSEGKVEEHVEQSLTGRGSHGYSSEEKLITYSSGPNES